MYKNELLKLEEELEVLSKINIPLSADPINDGLSNLNGKISEVQTAKDFASRITFDILKLKHKIEIQVFKEQIKLDRNKYALINKDKAYFASIKTQSLRDLELDFLLATELTLLESLHEQDSNIKMLFERVKNITFNLKSTNDNLKVQLSVLSFMQNIGEIVRKEGSCCP